MKAKNKTYYDFCPVFKQLGKKWLSMRFPVEETECGDKIEAKFRKNGSNDEWRSITTSIYFERFTDGHIIDIPMDSYNVKEGEVFEIEATKIDKE